MRYFIISIFVLFISCNTSKDKKEIQSVEKTILNEVETQNIYVVKTIIYAKDSLPITADIYEINNKRPTVLLCHQAGYSRGEYKDTALKLMKLGFSCVAIDQRSGKEVNGIINETSFKAKQRNLSTNYIDAKQDIESAIDYMYNLNGHQPIILVGSSYSATLTMLIGNKSDKVKAIAAFSPGEYYKTIDVKNAIKDISKPTFVTSSKKEIPALIELVSLINSDFVTHFKPIVEGVHGSKALWESTSGNEAYWQAFSSFLMTVY
mgnify:CR=1 FL=1